MAYVRREKIEVVPYQANNNKDIYLSKWKLHYLIKDE